MKIYLNHKEIECDEGICLTAMLLSRGIKTEGVAVAIDNKVVPKPEWDERVLEDGAKVTVIRAVCGG